MKIKVFFIISLLAITAAMPSSLRANEENWDYKVFDQKQELTRGSVTPTNNDGAYFEKNEACRFTKKKWGWNDLSCQTLDAFLIATGPNIDTLVIQTPNDDGYIKYDEWDSPDREENIEKIWTELKSMYALQSKSIEANMEVIRWLVRPTLVKKSNYMYYAYLIKQDGQTMPQIVATVFDRKGYIPFRLVPRNLTSSSSDEEFQETIEAALALYSPNTTEAYSDYTKGDKVSEYGVFGVLAALAGIKWGKAVAVGAFATFMLFAKKFWWIIFIPIAFFGRKLFKKKD